MLLEWCFLDSVGGSSDVYYSEVEAQVQLRGSSAEYVAAPLMRRTAATVGVVVWCCCLLSQHKQYPAP